MGWDALPRLEGWRRWGASGPLLHLAPANGFPPGTYRQLAEALAARVRVAAAPLLPLRPGTDPRSVRSWADVAEDLGRQLREAGLEDCVGIGHSLGAVVTALAAAADPGLFRGLVLVDPVLFTGRRRLVWSVMRRVGLAHRFRLARGARERRDRWECRNDVLKAWRRRGVFASWAPGVLEDYVIEGTREAEGGGVELVFPREWEARLFQVTPPDPWSAIRRIGVPVLAVRGEGSDTFLPEAARRLGRELPGARVVEVPGTGHFVPMERPRELAEIILDFVDGLDDPA